MIPPADESVETAFAGRYRLLQEVGCGGMAAVYLAEDLRHGRPVALKVIRPDAAAASGAARFLREIQLTAQLTHHHILPLLDSSETEGRLFYAVPFVEGESLRQWLVREPQPAGRGDGRDRGGDRRSLELRPRPGIRAPRHQAGEHVAGGAL
jgi:serine/threonine-protein kinase